MVILAVLSLQFKRILLPCLQKEICAKSMMMTGIIIPPSATSQSAPFITHYNPPTGQPYTVGDTREWQNILFRYCDAPTHKDRIKWHTHTAETCRTRLRWLHNKSNDGSHQRFRPIANIGEATTKNPPTQNTSNDTSSTSSNDNPTQTADAPSTDITALITNVLNVFGDNDIVRDLIVDTINTTSWQLQIVHTCKIFTILLFYS